MWLHFFTGGLFFALLCGLGLEAGDRDAFCVFLLASYVLFFAVDLFGGFFCDRMEAEADSGGSTSSQEILFLFYCAA